MLIHNWMNRLHGRRLTTRCFIVGAPRSGTTLVQARLACHPRLLSFFETHLYPRADGIGSRPEVQAGRSGADIYRQELSEVIAGICSALDIPPAPVMRLLRGRRVARLRTSFFQCLDEMAWRRKCLGWIEKTPAHVRYLSLIEQDVPDARFIHVFRDGVAVVASLREVTRRYPQQWGGAQWSLNRCIETWNQDIAASLEYRARQGHYLLAYESFVDETNNYVRNLWQFLGLKQAGSETTSLLSLSADAIVQPFERWKNNAIAPIQRGRNERSRALLTPAQIEYAKARLIHAGRVPPDVC